MTNIEQNAMRIAELIGNDNEDGCNAYERVIDCCGYTEWILNENKAIIKTFSSYQGLMPIVFECNTGFNTFAIRIGENQIQLLRNNKYVEFDHGDGGIYHDACEDEPLEFLFIEKIQLAVIKYLELKNETK